MNQDDAAGRSETFLTSGGKNRGARYSTQCGGLQNEKNTPESLADLEHEFWVSRDPVRLGIAACQHERDLQLSRRQRIRYPPALAGRSGHRLDRPTDHRRHERPHVELARSPPSLLFGGRDPFQPCVI